MKFLIGYIFESDKKIIK